MNLLWAALGILVILGIFKRAEEFKISFPDSILCGYGLQCFLLPSPWITGLSVWSWEAVFKCCSALHDFLLWLCTKLWRSEESWDGICGCSSHSSRCSLATALSWRCFQYHETKRKYLKDRMLLEDKDYKVMTFQLSSDFADMTFIEPYPDQSSCADEASVEYRGISYCSYPGRSHKMLFSEREHWGINHSHVIKGSPSLQSWSFHQMSGSLTRLPVAILRFQSKISFSLLVPLQELSSQIASWILFCLGFVIAWPASELKMLSMDLLLCCSIQHCNNWWPVMRDGSQLPSKKSGSADTFLPELWEIIKFPVWKTAAWVQIPHAEKKGTQTADAEFRLN